eukprot:376768-Amphidinium_carterae.2
MMLQEKWHPKRTSTAQQVLHKELSKEASEGEVTHEEDLGGRGKEFLSPRSTNSTTQEPTTKLLQHNRMSEIQVGFIRTAMDNASNLRARS